MKGYWKEESDNIKTNGLHTTWNKHINIKVDSVESQVWIQKGTYSLTLLKCLQWFYFSWQTCHLPAKFKKIKIYITWCFVLTPTPTCKLSLASQTWDPPISDAQLEPGWSTVFSSAIHTPQMHLLTEPRRQRAWPHIVSLGEPFSCYSC